MALTVSVPTAGTLSSMLRHGSKWSVWKYTRDAISSCLNRSVSLPIRGVWRPMAIYSKKAWVCRACDDASVLLQGHAEFDVHDQIHNARIQLRYNPVQPVPGEIDRLPHPQP